MDRSEETILLIPLNSNACRGGKSSTFHADHATAVWTGLIYSCTKQYSLSLFNAGFYPLGTAPQFGSGRGWERPGNDTASYN